MEVDGVSLLQLQNKGVGEVRSNVHAAVLPVFYDPFVVFVHVYRMCTHRW